MYIMYMLKISFFFNDKNRSINLYLGIFLILVLSLCLICLYFRYQVILNFNEILKEHWYLRNVFFKFNKLNVSIISFK